ncbi:MAG: phosphatidylglycerophosphatase A [Gammaproteobacteria bacterium]
MALIHIPANARVWSNPIHLLAFGFGSGLAAKAPGTFGTLAGLLLFLPLAMLPWYGYVLMLLVTTAAGIWICGRTADDLGIHDHGGIVWDEFVGLWITLFMVPMDWRWILAGFALFRLLDILKPWPIKWADKQVEGGLGIMLDDVLAGIMAALCLQAARILIA